MPSDSIGATADTITISGTMVNPHRFVGAIRVSTLLRMTSDPLATEKTRDRAESRRYQDAYELRKDIQREFKGAKRRNVDSFAEYLWEVNSGIKDGLAPAIKLFSPMQFQTRVEPDGRAFCYIDTSAEIVAFDGETQLAGWFRATARHPEMRELYVPVDLSHGRTATWGRKSWHDNNNLGSLANKALALSMDTSDPMNRVAAYIEEQVPFFEGRVNRIKRQLGRGDKEYLLLTSLRGACVTFTKDIGGVSLGQKPVSVDEGRLPLIMSVAEEWFGGLADALGDKIADRSAIASTPPVFTALGAVGHPLLAIEDYDKRAAVREEILHSLASVDWSRGQHWGGIAGKTVTKDRNDSGDAQQRLALGGPKEYSYLVFKALTDRKHPSYRLIREPDRVPTAA